MGPPGGRITLSLEPITLQALTELVLFDLILGGGIESQVLLPDPKSTLGDHLFKPSGKRSWSRRNPPLLTHEMLSPGQDLPGDQIRWPGPGLWGRERIKGD